jgi:hypothetical protein
MTVRNWPTYEPLYPPSELEVAPKAIESILSTRKIQLGGRVKVVDGPVTVCLDRTIEDAQIHLQVLSGDKLYPIVDAPPDYINTFTIHVFDESGNPVDAEVEWLVVGFAGEET